MDCDDEVFAKCGYTLCLSWCAPAQGRDVLLELLQQLLTRDLCPLPVTTRHDERQSRARIGDIRCVRGAREGKQWARILRAVLCKVAEQPVTDSEADAATEGAGGVVSCFGTSL